MDKITALKKHIEILHVSLQESSEDEKLDLELHIALLEEQLHRARIDSGVEAMVRGFRARAKKERTK